MAITHRKISSGTINADVEVDLYDWNDSHVGLENVPNVDTTNASNITSGTLVGARMPALTGDVTTSVGAVATTIAANAVTNAKAAQMAANTIKGNNTGGTANAADLTATQVIALLGRRTRLTANTTYNVTTAGNDTTGDGTVGLPFLTLNGAYDYINKNIDCAGFLATIQVAAGTYGALAVFGPAVQGARNSLSGIKFKGDTTTPSNVVVSTAGAACVTCTGAGAVVLIEGFKFTSSGADCLYASGGGFIDITGNVEFGSAAGYHKHANVTGQIVSAAASYTISGGAQCHFLASKCAVIEDNATSVTLTGTPAFSLGYAVAIGGYVIHAGCTFTGAATGPRYLSISNGVVDNGNVGNVNYFPGNSAGSTNTGGVYSS